MDCVHRAHGKVQWWAIVYMIMNLLVSKKAKNFLTSLAAKEFLVASIETLMVVMFQNQGLLSCDAVLCWDTNIS